MISDLPNLPGLARHGAHVRRAFVSACESLGFDQDQADALAGLIEHESGWKAAAVNPTGGATGLIQFMPATAKGLGTSVGALRAMSEIEQLPFVVRYFKHFRTRLAPREIPIAVFMPSLVGKPDNHVAFQAPATGYRWNKGLDTDKDGRITLGEVRAHALRPLAAAASRPRLPIDTDGAAAGSLGVGTVIAIAVGALWLVRKAVA